MANLNEVSNFDEGVYQIEVEDFIEGGSTGIHNRPIKSLANRTRWLKNKLESIWDDMPVASISVLGGIRIGRGIKMEANGICVVDIDAVAADLANHYYTKTVADQRFLDPSEIKTVNGQSLIGQGNVEISGGVVAPVAGDGFLIYQNNRTRWIESTSYVSFGNTGIWANVTGRTHGRSPSGEGWIFSEPSGEPYYFKALKSGSIRIKIRVRETRGYSATAGILQFINLPHQKWTIGIGSSSPMTLIGTTSSHSDFPATVIPGTNRTFSGATDLSWDINIQPNMHYVVACQGGSWGYEVSQFSISSSVDSESLASMIAIFSL